MRKQTLIAISLILSLLTSGVFAANQLSCAQLDGTHWSDSSDSQFGNVSLELDESYAMVTYYGGNFQEGSDITSCVVQPDGSLLITLAGFYQNEGYLVLQTDDLKTLKVLPGSKLSDHSGKRVAIHGPFVRN